jgi:hypothetical protein
MDMDRKLDFGSAFSRVFDLYGKHFVPLITYAAIFYFVIAAIMALVLGVLITSVTAGALLGLVGIVVAIIGSMLLTGAYIIALTEANNTGSFPSFGEVWPRVTPKLGALIVTAIIAGIGIMLGFILLIIPGLVLATWWYVASPVVMLEDKSGFDALGRSRELVRGNGWTVFALFLVVSILTGIAGGILGGIAGAILGFNDIASEFANQFVSGTLTAPISALLTVVVYEALTGTAAGEVLPPPLSAPDAATPPPTPEPPSSSGPFV